MFQPVQDGTINWLFIGGTLVVGGGLLALLHGFAPPVRRWVIAILTFLAGLYFALEFFMPRHNVLTPWRDSVADLLQVLAAFTFGLGVLNQFLIHGRNILHRTPNWPFSVAFFSGFLLMLGTGLLQHYAPHFLAAVPPQGAIGVLGFWEAAYRVLFEGALQALSATVFALLAFFIASAAYRAFRIRTLEAGLLMVTATIVMLANVPIGQQWLTGWIPEESPWAWLRLEKLAHWLQTQINAPTMRAILFGLWVGALGMALRIILGLERSFTIGRQ
ncbi:hypothetical protein HRbin17_00477 [bacterium HR17]|uniref:Uncharacterized protein n=1 Tax=Candidatus Fervidibacter japonicus TaxID=2035412 RepID=A0A2H5X9X6_9BACT|nr:hypothetical protein HRbin17_00477 [bacterium HR17]